MDITFEEYPVLMTAVMPRRMCRILLESIASGHMKKRDCAEVFPQSEKSFTVAVSNVLARCVADVLSSSLLVATSQLFSFHLG